MEDRVFTLKDLLLDTRDGDWGEEVPKPGYAPYRVIRGTDFSHVRIGDLSPAPVRYISAASASRRTLKAGDILIETAGGSRDRPTGRVAFITDRLVSGSDLPLSCASFCRYMRVDSLSADSAYVYWYLQYLYSLGEMWQHQVQHTGIARFQYTNFATITPIPLPSINEQRAIASILGALDDKIELNRRMNATLEALARALFTSWFVDFDPVRAKAEGRQPAGMDAATAALFPDGFEESAIGPIPRGWHVANLPELFSINPPRTLRAGEVAPYLDMGNMPTSSARAVDCDARAFGSGMRFVNGDVLVARITPCLENGKTAFVDFLPEGQVGWGSTEYIVLRSKPPLPLEYAYFLARSDDFRSFAVANMTGTSGRQRVPVDCLSTYLVVAPSRATVERFGLFAHETLAVMKSHDEQSRTLAAIRDALLPKLLSGAVRVREAETMVEAAL